MRRRPIFLAAITALLAGSAAAQDGGAPAAEQAQGAPDPKAFVEQLRAELLKPGPVVPGWNVGGADPNADIEAVGADKHYFLSEEEDGERSLQIRTSRRIDSLAPASWRAVDSFGSPVAYAPNPSVGFTPMGTRFVIASRFSDERVNGLDCGEGPTHAILYERSDGAASEDRASAIGIFRTLMLAAEGQTVCSRSEGNGRNGWRVRFLLPDGRDLPSLNEEETRLRIVPAAPIESLVRGNPLPAEVGEAKQ